MKVYDENYSWRRVIRDDLLQQWPDDIMLVDIAQLESCRLPMNKVIVVSDKTSTKDVLMALNALGVRQVVQLSNPKVNSSIQLSAHMISKLDEVMATPVEILFSSQGIPFQIERFPFRSSKQKTDTLKQVETYITTFVKSSQVITNIHTIADELYTNAIFHAPVDSQGRHRNSKTRRNAMIELDPDASAEMIVAHNEQILFIGCTDSYGSLSLNSVMGRLTTCIEKGVGQAINLGEGGSGIGCFLVLENASSFIILVHPGKKTVMGGLIHYTLSERLRATIPKNMHIGIASEV